MHKEGVCPFCSKGEEVTWKAPHTDIPASTVSKKPTPKYGDDPPKSRPKTPNRGANEASTPTPRRSTRLASKTIPSGKKQSFEPYPKRGETPKSCKPSSVLSQVAMMGPPNPEPGPSYNGGLLTPPTASAVLYRPNVMSISDIFQDPDDSELAGPSSNLNFQPQTRGMLSPFSHSMQQRLNHGSSLMSPVMQPQMFHPNYGMHPSQYMYNNSQPGYGNQMSMAPQFQNNYGYYPNDNLLGFDQNAFFAPPSPVASSPPPQADSPLLGNIRRLETVEEMRASGSWDQDACDFLDREVDEILGLGMDIPQHFDVPDFLGGATAGSPQPKLITTTQPSNSKAGATAAVKSIDAEHSAAPGDKPSDHELDYSGSLPMPAYDIHGHKTGT